MSFNIFRDDYSPTMIFVPTEVLNESYIFKVMCEGGIVGDQVFNVVTENVLILRNGSAPQSHRDVCPVGFKAIHDESLVIHVYVPNFRKFIPLCQHYLWMTTLQF